MLKALTLSLVLLAPMPVFAGAGVEHQVRVLVLNYDPIVPSMGGQRLHDALGFQDPQQLATGYINQLGSSTNGHVGHTIVEWRDLDEIPVKQDGYQYTVSEYVQNWQSGSGWHQPDTMDYVAELQAQGVSAMIDADLIDEVWLFGAPYFGYWEAAMAGPGAFFINGGVYPQINSQRPFAIMGFNYERNVAEMLHSLGHRAENCIRRVFGGWNVQNPQTDWDHFTVNRGQSNALTGVGNIHFPANGDSDYDYSNFDPVLSTALDWSNYPDLTGATTMISAANWNNLVNTSLGYMVFWFSLLPRADGLHPVHGRSNDWYAFVYDWLSYDANGRPIHDPPQNYCVATLNSSGLPADISSVGFPSLSINNFHLLASNVPPSSMGMFFFGDHEQQLPFGNGWLCVANPITRLGVMPSDHLGQASFHLDFTIAPAVDTITGPSRHSFQYWFRDSGSGGPASFNTSDGLRVEFTE